MCVISDHIVLGHHCDFCILMSKFDISFPHGCTFFAVVFFCDRGLTLLMSQFVYMYVTSGCPRNPGHARKS